MGLLPFRVVQNFVQRIVDGVPLGEEESEGGFALRGEVVEAFVALVFFAPLAGEEALGFEAAEEGVEGAFLDGEAFVGEGFAESVAVVLGAKLGEDGDDEAAAAEFEAEGVEELGIGGIGLDR
jgi:hypothetical protein